MSDEVKSAFAYEMRKLAEYENSKINVEEYRQAVESLVPFALTDTSGGRAAAGVLLSCYNAYKFHLDVTDLCLLDFDLYQAAIKVIRGRVELSKEPHQLIRGCKNVCVNGHTGGRRFDPLQGERRGHFQGIAGPTDCRLQEA